MQKQKSHQPNKRQSDYLFRLQRRSEIFLRLCRLATGFPLWPGFAKIPPALSLGKERQTVSKAIFNGLSRFLLGEFLSWLAHYFTPFLPP